MNDHFTMRCPKCSSTGLERFSDRATTWGGTDSFALKCRVCGKTMYGEETCQAEWDRQYKAWKKDAPARKAALVEAAEQAEAQADFDRRMAEADRKRREEAQRKAEAAREKKEAENRAWAEKVAKQREQERLSASNRDECAWKDCDEPSRRNSIYCSRACSNKNARWRHKQRQKEQEQRKSGAAA